MHIIRMLLAAMLLVSVLPAQAAANDDADWQLFGRVLALVQSVVHVAAQSNDPQSVERQIDSLLSGRNAEANRLAGDLMGDAFEDMPQTYRGTVLALANDFAVIARKERTRQGAGKSGESSALQARKDLAAVGLRYYDQSQFLDAVMRNDALAVELFVAGRGVEVGMRDPEGMTALDHAKRRNHRRITELLAGVAR